MRQLRTLLVIGGMLTCLLGIGSLMLPIHPAIAQSLPLPDRPTLTPRPIPAESKQSNPIVATSRIAGTVIDTRTGVPTAGITVQVGDTMVKTDANGNYDLNGLVAGTYTIALVLSADQSASLRMQALFNTYRSAAQHRQLNQHRCRYRRHCPGLVAMRARSGCSWLVC